MKFGPAHKMEKVINGEEKNHDFFLTLSFFSGLWWDEFSLRIEKRIITIRFRSQTEKEKKETFS